MKTAIVFVVISATVAVFALMGGSDEPPSGKIVFERLPAKGFNSKEEMVAFAKRTSHAPKVEEFTVNGEGVFVMQRSAGSSGAVNEVTVFRSMDGVPWLCLSLPAVIGNLRVTENGGVLKIEKFGGRKEDKRVWVTVIEMRNLP